MNQISKRQLLQLREEYPTGTRVELVKMKDHYSQLSNGAAGTVILVDDIGTIHVEWDSGSTLGVVLGEDFCKKIDE